MSLIDKHITTAILIEFINCMLVFNEVFDSLNKFESLFSSAIKICNQINLTGKLIKQEQSNKSNQARAIKKANLV